MRQSFRLTPAVLGLFLWAGAATAQQTRGPERWVEDIQRFEAADEERPFAPGGVVFVGSSSIRFWNTLAEDFPRLRTLNRGFGGSQLADVRHYLDDLVLKHRPATVVLYAGENDIAYGATAERVFNDYIGIVSEIRRELPDTRLVFISIKPGPTRWDDAREIRKLNDMVMEFAARDPLLDFVDVFTPMLGEDGLPIPDLYVEDGIHMTPKGYEIWTRLVEPYVRGGQGALR